MSLRDGLDVLTQTSAATATALIGSVFGVQKLLKMLRGSTVELELINALAGELKRINEYNQTLSKELGDVQKDFIRINKDLRDLSEENQKLHYEVTSLTLEVQRLNAALN